MTNVPAKNNVALRMSALWTGSLVAITDISAAVDVASGEAPTDRAAAGGNNDNRSAGYVRNVFDSRGQLSVVFPQFGSRMALIQPRTFGLSVSTSF